MLELHDQTIPSVYLELFPFLLMPVLWERPGYIPALVKLLQSYIIKASTSIVSEKIVNMNKSYLAVLKLEYSYKNNFRQQY